MTDVAEKLAKLAIVLGSLLIVSGLVVFCAEAWLWFARGEWNSIPVAAAVDHFVSWTVQMPSSSGYVRYLYWLTQLSLDKALLTLGLGVSALGLYLLG